MEGAAELSVPLDVDVGGVELGRDPLKAARRLNFRLRGRPIHVSPWNERLGAGPAEPGGRSAGISRLFERYQRQVLALAVGMTGAATTPWMSPRKPSFAPHKNLASFLGESSFYTWLYRIAVNLAIDFRRRHVGRHGSLADRPVGGEAIWMPDCRTNAWRIRCQQDRATGIGVRILQQQSTS